MKHEKLAKWWNIITYGDSKKYTKFIAWLFLDSFVASIPSSVLMVAVYYLLAPILDSTKAYAMSPTVQIKQARGLRQSLMVCIVTPQTRSEPL